MYACVHLPGSTPYQRAALRDCAARFSPNVQEPAPGLFVFDVRGLGRLHGSPAEIAAAVHRSAPSGARIAVAPNPFTASAAARGCEGVTVIPPGQELRTLRHLPLSLLDPGEGLAETLAAWGIRTFGQLAALPERGVAERLGKPGILLRRKACGIADDPLVAIVEPTIFEASLELEHPVELLEPLSFLLARLLNDVCARLGSHGFAANEIQAELQLEGGKLFCRRITLPYAGRDPVAFLKLLQLDLAAHPPDAPVLRVAIKAQPVEPRRVQAGLFLPQAPEAQKLELTLARLAGLVGEGNAGTPELLDTHRPGAFRMVKFTVKANVEPAAKMTTPHLAMRVFRPPLPAAVVTDHGYPRRISARGIRGEVVAWAGPWRTSGDWWQPGAWSRDEWDVGLANGELYRLIRQQDRWSVEGNYD